MTFCRDELKWYNCSTSMPSNGAGSLGLICFFSFLSVDQKPNINKKCWVILIIAFTLPSPNKIASPTLVSPPVRQEYNYNRMFLPTCRWLAVLQIEEQSLHFRELGWGNKLAFLHHFPSQGPDIRAGIKAFQANSEKRNGRVQTQ